MNIYSRHDICRGVSMSWLMLCNGGCYVMRCDMLIAHYLIIGWTLGNNYILLILIAWLLLISNVIQNLINSITYKFSQTRACTHTIARLYASKRVHIRIKTRACTHPNVHIKHLNARMYACKHAHVHIQMLACTLCAYKPGAFT